jgi:hypothetical protein
MKYCLNIIKSKLFTQQVGWFGGKGVELHLWALKSNFTNEKYVVVNIGILIKYFIPT